MAQSGSQAEEGLVWAQSQLSVVRLREGAKASGLWARLLLYPPAPHGAQAGLTRGRGREEGGAARPSPNCDPELFIELLQSGYLRRFEKY